MPNDADPNVLRDLGRPVRDKLRSGARGLAKLDAQQAGFAAAALLTFVGVAYLGPALTRWLTPRTRAQRMKDEAAYQAETLRRRASAAGKKVRKRARRLGGDAAERYL